MDLKAVRKNFENLQYNIPFIHSCDDPKKFGAF
jgi:hypothetical protein